MMAARTVIASRKFKKYIYIKYGQETLACIYLRTQVEIIATLFEGFCDCIP